MANKRVQPVVEWLKRVATEPQSELTRWQRAVRFGYDLGRHGAKQLRRDRAPQMAGALAFRTLFGLLPVMVVASVLAKALMGRGELRQFMDRTIRTFIDNLGMTGITVSSATNAGTEEGPRTLADFLIAFIDPVADLNLAALGWMGIAIVIYAAIGLMVTIERSFNVVTGAPEGRPWILRITIYWTVLTVSPLAMALMFYLDAFFRRTMESVEAGQWLLMTANVLWSFIAVWLFMTAVYKLVPNRTVKLKSAMTGALVAAVLLEIGKRTLGAYLLNAIPVNLLYGTLGLIPLFMFWVYLMWLVVLFGLEVATTLQMLAGRTLDEIEQKRRISGLVDPASVLTVMEIIADRFAASLPTTGRRISEQIGLPGPTVEIMVRQLVEAGFLHRLEGDSGEVSLARPPERISAAELMEVGFSLADEGGSGRKPVILQHLREAQRSLAARETLAGMLCGQPAGKGSDKVAPA
ncbi:MAG: YihY family inner membrane protein [Phycisphaerales bacterium]|nr:MAG: YihY family inner membrane protein [Phycisphaerales bacterium]